MRRRIEQVDADTGEVIEGACLVLVPKQKMPLGYTRWFAMNQDVLEVLTQFKRVDDYRVLFALLKRLDFENYINTSQAEIAKELDMHRQHVNRAIKNLIAAEAIIEGPKVGINRTYRLNVNFGWKGSVTNHKKAVAEQMKDRMEKANISGVIDGKTTPERDPDTADMFDQA